MSLSNSCVNAEEWECMVVDITHCIILHCSSSSFSPSLISVSLCLSRTHRSCHALSLSQSLTLSLSLCLSLPFTPSHWFQTRPSTLACSFSQALLSNWAFLSRQSWETGKANKVAVIGSPPLHVVYDLSPFAFHALASLFVLGKDMFSYLISGNWKSQL